MRKIIHPTLLVLFLLTLSINLKAQDSLSTTKINYKDSTLLGYLNNFNDMHISYYGSTQFCEAYNVYAFKYRKNWFLIVDAANKISVMHVNPPIKNKSIYYPSLYFIEGISKSHFIGYTKLVKKKKHVIDMDIYGFYKFNKYGRKVIKGLLYLEYPFYNKGILNWKLDEEKAEELVKNKIKEEIKPIEIETIKTEINENIPIEKK